MTLQDAILSFYRQMEDDGYPLSSKAQAMMTYLIVEANKHRERDEEGRWRFPLYVEIKQQDLMKALNISRRETLYKSRDELVEAGYLLFVPGFGAQHAAYIALLTRPDDFNRIRIDKSRGDCLIKLVRLARFHENKTI